MEFITSHPLYFLLGIAGVFTFFWLFAFRRRLRAKWYALLIISVLHIFVGVLFVKLFAFLESPGEGYKGAMSLFGAVFFMPLTYFAGAKIFKRDIREVFDLFAVPLLFTLACARVNCLFSGCCKGQIIPFITSHTVRWPTRETELVFYAILLTVFIVTIIKKKNFGQLYPLYMTTYGVFRFIIEFFRVTETSRTAGLFHLAHLWAVVSFCIGAGILFELIYIKNSKRKKKNKRKKNHV